MQVDDEIAVIGYIRTLPPILLQAQAGLAAAQRFQGFQLEAYVVVGILDNLHRQRAAYGRVSMGGEGEQRCRGREMRERAGGWVEVERGRRGGRRRERE